MNVKCPGCGKTVKLGGDGKFCPRCGWAFAGAVGGSALPRSSVTDGPEVYYTPPPRRGGPFAWMSDNTNLVMIGAVGVVVFMILIGVVVLIAARPWERSTATTAPPPPPPRPLVIAPPTAVAPSVTPAAPTTTVAAAPPPPFLFLTNLKPRQPARSDTEPVTDEQIGQALEKGVEYILSLFQNGRLRKDLTYNQDVHDGFHSLAVYALLHASATLPDERLKSTSVVMRPLIDNMKKLSIATGHATYSRALRIAALSMLNRPVDRRVMEDDVQFLLKSSVDGGFGYDMPPANAARESYALDCSNSQYGALGLWLASDAGVYVPKLFWRDVEKYWTARQMSDGRWPYTSGNPNPALTSAGVNMLFVARSKLADDARMGKVGLPPYSPALQKGLDWLAADDNAIKIDGDFRGYTMYSIERAGLASGFRFFGKHDWYKSLAGQVVRTQLPNGSWNGYMHPGIETSLITLTLTRGRHSVALSKLRYPGAWANRPDDAMHLTEFVSKQVERPLNWQVVDIDRTWQEWLDTPVILLTGHEAPAFLNDPKVIEQVTGFVNAGGLIFSNADNESPAFTQAMAALARRISGGAELAPLSPDHPLYNALFNIRPAVPDDAPKPVLPSLKPAAKPTTNPAPTRPVLWGVTRGARLLMVHSPTDLARRWQDVDENRAGAIVVDGKTVKVSEREIAAEQRRFALEAAANVFIYAAGKRDYRNRLESPYIQGLSSGIVGDVPVARLKYDGQWDPEPQAWDRQSRWTQAHGSLNLKTVVKPLDGLKFTDAPVAHLTGIGPRRFSVEEVDAVRDYVETGGVLLIDATGGDSAFIKSVREGLLPSSFPQQGLSRIDPKHPILTGDGTPFTSDLHEPVLNDFSNFSMRDQDVRPFMFTAGRGVVVLCELDLTTALLGVRTFGYNGYESDWATKFVNNVIIWMLSREELKVAGG